MDMNMDMPNSTEVALGSGMDGMDDTTGMDGMDGMTGMDGMSMAMYFNFMLPLTVIFEGWRITDQAGLIGSCFGVFGLGVLYEMMKNLRKLWEAKVHSQLAEKIKSDKSNPYVGKYWIYHFSQSVLHMIQVFFAYLLMLVVMTYNVWLVISVSVGAGVGYLVSGGILTTMLPTPSEETPLSRQESYSKYSDKMASTSSSSSLGPPSYHDNKAMTTF